MQAVVNSDLTLVTALYRATNAIVRELDQRLGKEHDVTFIQAVTLLAVDSFDRPQPHLVADYLSQQSQTVTGVLDRLERAGHITRRRDLQDRRAVRLQLTASGEQLVRAISRELRNHVDSIFGRLDGGIRERLDADLQELERSVRQMGSP